MKNNIATNHQSNQFQKHDRIFFNYSLFVPSSSTLLIKKKRNKNGIDENHKDKEKLMVIIIVGFINDIIWMS